MKLIFRRPCTYLDSASFPYWEQPAWLWEEKAPCFRFSPALYLAVIAGHGSVTIGLAEETWICFCFAHVGMTASDEEARNQVLLALPFRPLVQTAFSSCEFQRHNVLAKNSSQFDGIVTNKMCCTTRYSRNKISILVLLGLAPSFLCGEFCLPKGFQATVTHHLFR